MNGVMSAADDGVDTTALPGNDFSAYANGAWLKATRIPAGKVKWGAGAEIAERSQMQTVRLLDEAGGAKPGSDERKVADYRAAMLDDSAIEAHGLVPLRPAMARIDHIRDKTTLSRYLGSDLGADVDPMNLGVFDSQHFLGIAVQAGNHGERTYVAYLLQGGLGLPSRDHYLSEDAPMKAIRAGYLAAIADVLGQLGERAGAPAPGTTKRAEAVLALETAIARSHATVDASSADHDTSLTWTRADFAKRAPGMHWDDFFASAGLAKQSTFVAWQPSALIGAGALVDGQPLQAWKDYLRIRIIARRADMLPRTLRSDGLTLRGDVPAPDPAAARAQRVLAETEAAMGNAIGKLYVDRYFPPRSKARLQLIVANVAAAFRERIQRSMWLSEESKVVALLKLRKMYFGVGYPERWQDYSDLDVEADDPVGNHDRAVKRNYQRTTGRLGRLVDQTEWVVEPQWPGAVLTFHQNAYNFSAALLQPPKFDAAASDAATYGAIGAIFGHEISHFVDTLGADYDADGRAHRWWTARDLARYQAVTAPLVDQFSAYRPFDDTAVDGKLSLTENVADLGGLVAAFDAYRATMAVPTNDRESLHQQDRAFFIGWARAWRAVYQDSALRKQATTDHAPERYRISTVRNMDAWYEAFDVKPGQQLWLDEDARVRLW